MEFITKEQYQKTLDSLSKFTIERSFKSVGIVEHVSIGRTRLMCKTTQGENVSYFRFPQKSVEKLNATG